MFASGISSLILSVLDGQGAFSLQESQVAQPRISYPAASSDSVWMLDVSAGWMPNNPGTYTPHLWSKDSMSAWHSALQS